MQDSLLKTDLRLDRQHVLDRHAYPRCVAEHQALCRRQDDSSIVGVARASSRWEILLAVFRAVYSTVITVYSKVLGAHTRCKSRRLEQEIRAFLRRREIIEEQK